MFLSSCRDSIEFRARHGLDVHAHSPVAGSIVALSFGDSETEIVLMAFIGRDSHLEDAEAFRPWLCNFMVVVCVFDSFEALFLAEFKFVCNGAFEVNWQGVLEAELELSVGLDDRCFGRLDQVALLRDVFIGNIVLACLADAADFLHVRVCGEVDIAANRREIGWNFEIIPVLGG